MNILFIFILYEYPIRFIMVGGLEHECYFSTTRYYIILPIEQAKSE